MNAAVGGVFVSQAYDDGDSQLDSNEFLRFLKHNETALNITYSDTLQTNLLLRYSFFLIVSRFVLLFCLYIAAHILHIVLEIKWLLKLHIQTSPVICLLLLSFS